MGPEALCFFVVRPSVCMCVCALHVFACIHVESFSTSLLSTSSCICIADQCRFAYFVVIILFCIYIRDVNSWEIAFPGQESQFPGIDRDSLFHPSTYLLLARSESDRRRGCEGGGERGDRRPVEDAGPHRRVRTTDQQRAVLHPKRHTMIRGARSGKCNGRSAPGRQAGESTITTLSSATHTKPFDHILLLLVIGWWIEYEPASQVSFVIAHEYVFVLNVLEHQQLTTNIQTAQHDLGSTFTSIPVFTEL